MNEKDKCKDINTHNFPDFGMKTACVWCGKTVQQVREEDAKAAQPTPLPPTLAQPTPVPPQPQYTQAQAQAPPPMDQPPLPPQNQEQPKKGYITYETAAREIYYWLKRSNMLAYMAMAGPFAAVAGGFFNTNVGAVIAMTLAIVSVIIWKPLKDETKRIGQKYKITPSGG